jgi:hypothetical protein
VPYWLYSTEENALKFLFAIAFVFSALISTQAGATETGDKIRADAREAKAEIKQTAKKVRKTCADGRHTIRPNGCRKHGGVRS